MRFAPLLLTLAVALVVAPRADAQCSTAPTVTVRQINQIPQENLDFLTANAATLTPEQIQEKVVSTLELQVVKFTGVVLSDPRKSGLRSLNAAGVPNSINFFVRDVTAASAGVEGMGIQVIDPSGTGLAQQFFVGDEVSFCGKVEPFRGTGGVSMQISLIEATYTGTTVEPTDPILDPVVITTDDIENIVNDNQTQIDWSVYPTYNGQYVRFESIQVIQGVPGNRPDVLLQSVGKPEQINLYDTSVCFRNDRTASYFPAGTTPPQCIQTPFVPPATGIVNVQGFLTFQGDTGGFNYSFPTGANWVVNPFEESDFVVSSAPPIITVDGVATVPAPNEATTITATIAPGSATGSITSANLFYSITGGASATVALTNTSGDTYTAQIPGGPNLAFVTYSVTATDNVGASTTSPNASYRIFSGAINAIALVQTTADGGPGASPLITGAAAAFDLNAVVQTKYQSGTNWFATIQDDPTLAPFSGVLIFFGSAEPAFAVGDRINVTEATISEFNGLTQLSNVTFTVTSSGTPYPAKVLTTNLFNGGAGAATSEKHEGLLLRFENVTITDVNADGADDVPGFGEWRFSSTASDAQGLRADDASNDVPQTFNVDNLVIGQGRAFMQGVLSYANNNYKLIPTTLADIGQIVTAGEDGAEASAAARLVGSFPNPAAGTATVRFELAEAGPVSLRLYDVMGREVAVVADGPRAAGANAATLDVSGLAAGVYVLRLEASGASAAARLSVVR